MLYNTVSINRPSLRIFRCVVGIHLPTPRTYHKNMLVDIMRPTSWKEAIDRPPAMKCQLRYEGYVRTYARLIIRFHTAFSLDTNSKIRKYLFYPEGNRKLQRTVPSCLLAKTYFCKWIVSSASCITRQPLYYSSTLCRCFATTKHQVPCYYRSRVESTRTLRVQDFDEYKEWFIVENTPTLLLSCQDNYYYYEYSCSVSPQVGIWHRTSYGRKHKDRCRIQ